jgi:DNA polymerase-3 subunit gamma/tau
VVLPYGDGDIYHKYRPRKFSEIVGHKNIVESIKNAIVVENPSHSFLLTGDSGTGKTTTARIMAASLNCEQSGYMGDGSGEPCLECRPCKAITSGKCMDVIEKNAAEHRGIDAVREISKSMFLMPMTVVNKVYILDEFHQMTKDAQTSLLKVLEEAPKNVFIILCTTHPAKILPTVKNRCQQFTFKSLRKAEIVGLLNDVATLETGQSLHKNIISMIADSAAGSARQALVTLQQTLQLGEITEESVGNIINTETKDPAIMKLCFAAGKKSWPELMTIYKEVRPVGAPAIGMIMAGVLRNQLIGAKSPLMAKRLGKLLELFVVPFDDSKLGENQLVLALHKLHDASGGKY